MYVYMYVCQAKQFLLLNKLSVFASLFCVCMCMYGVSARMIRHLKFLHKNPDVMIHIRAYEEYDGNQEKHGAKSFRDGVHTYIQYSTCIHAYTHFHILTYIQTHSYLHTYIHTCIQTQK